MAKRFFAFFLCCLLVIPCLTVPSKAVDIDIGVVDLFDWAIGIGVHGGNFLSAFFDEDKCPMSPSTDSLHNFVQKRTQVDGKVGLYYVCEYCGKSAGEVGQEAYNDYVGTLPATGYNSDGTLLYYPIHVYTQIVHSKLSYNYVHACSHYLGDYASAGSADVSFDCDSYTIEAYLRSGKSSFEFLNYPSYFFDVKCPIDGFYERAFSGSYSGYYLLTDGSRVDFSYDGSYSSSLGTYYSAGSSFSYNPSLNKVGINIPMIYYYSKYNPPYYKITPYDSLIGGINSTYNVTTRPTGITGGNYGIVGDNGQITKVTNNTSIINETNNTYYNPATGNSQTMNSWSYDYSDRSYNITLENGDTITVTYGDENITIVEGDIIYNIYYIIDGSGSGSDPAPSPSTNPEPTASLDPNPGTSSAPSSPPSGGNDDNPDDMDDGGLLEWINNLIQYLSDHLSGAVELILSFFRAIPEMFGGFLDFLSAIFPYLPDEIIFLLTFGIAAVVFIAIIKAIRR